MSTDDTYKLALVQNKTWAQRTSTENPTLFPTLANGQHPQILWIGCSDSRIPETTVLGLNPGDVFVHRNIANILHPGDLNSNAVILYAVKHLKVKHIVVCGHTSCGGVNAALANQNLGLIDAWLLPLRALRMNHSHKWSGLSPQERAQKLTEANVLAGVRTLRENAAVIDGMEERGVQVHGLVYNVGTGELKELDVDEPELVKHARIEAFETSEDGKRKHNEKSLPIHESKTEEVK